MVLLRCIGREQRSMVVTVMILVSKSYQLKRYNVETTALCKE